MPNAITFVVAHKYPSKMHQFTHSTTEKYAYACSKVLSTFLQQQEISFESIKTKIESPKSTRIIMTTGVKNLFKVCASHIKVSGFST